MNLPVSPGTALADRVWVKIAVKGSGELGLTVLRP